MGKDISGSSWTKTKFVVIFSNIFADAAKEPEATERSQQILFSKRIKPQTLLPQWLARHPRNSTTMLCTPSFLPCAFSRFDLRQVQLLLDK